MTDILDEKALMQLQSAYRDRLRETARFLAAFPDFEGKCNEAERQNLEQLAHGMAGSGAIFGFAAVSAAGEALDLFLRRNREDPDLLRQLVRQLQNACAEAARRDGVFNFKRDGVDS